MLWGHSKSGDELAKAPNPTPIERREMTTAAMANTRKRFNFSFLTTPR